MNFANLSFIIAIIALLISIWGRLEMFFTTNRQKKLEQAKRIGEALVSAQILKNTLSKNIDAMELFTKDLNNSKINQLYKTEFNQRLDNLKSEYLQIWNLVKGFEKLIGYFQIGKNSKIEPSVIEAKIAHFNQKRELAQFDIEYLNNFIRKELKIDLPIT